MMLKHYRVEPKPLGIGYYGVVYQAYDPLQDRKVAIKKIKIEGGKKEADILSKVNSPFLPTFYDFFIEDDFSYVVMEFIDGKKIGGGFSAKITPWEEKKGVQLLINLLHPIQRIHQMGFIHNDIMPKNIMVKDDKPENVKLFDLNMAKEIKNEDMIRKDLRNLAEVGMILLYGELPKEITGTELDNKALMSVLMKALKPMEGNRFDSAKQISKALKSVL